MMTACFGLSFQSEKLIENLKKKRTTLSASLK